MADPANECFALRREDGSLTGAIKPRALVHRDGDLHGASHVFLARLRGGRAELLLQKRSAQKDSFPGLYDISAAGHLDPGEDFAAAARRELAEELGVTGEEILRAMRENDPRFCLREAEFRRLLPYLAQKFGIPVDKL